MGKSIEAISDEAIEALMSYEFPGNVREFENIEWVLHQVGENKTKAAEILGIDRVSLWRKLKRYNIGESAKVLQD